MPFDTLEQMVVTTAEYVRPPERLTVSQAAEKYRYVNNPGSYVGPWQNDKTPYLVEPMDVLGSLDFTAMIFVGPAQCGKTDMLMNWLTSTAICDPADMMVVQMSMVAARDFAKRRIERLFRHSKEVGSRRMSGRQYQNIYDTQFRNGMMLSLSWPAINELSGKPIPRLWLTDYDRMPEDVDGEGSPFDLARKRATTFGRYGMTVAESSPGWEVEEPAWVATTKHEAPPTRGVLALYNRGDRRRWYWRCAQCRDVFEPDFEFLKWPASKDHMESAEQAFMACPHCGGVIYHDGDRKRKTPGKHELNVGGRWVPDGMAWGRDGQLRGKPYRSDIASFWLKGVAATFADWKTLVLNYLKATEEFESTGSEQALKTTVTTDQGTPYVPKSYSGERLPEDLKGRAEDLGDRVVPVGVRFLVATVDIQRSRFVVQVHGFGVRGDVWIIDRFDIRKSKRLDEDGERWPVSPGSYAEDWHLLVDEVIERTYPLDDESGRRMAIRAVGCDSGGREGVTANAYTFWRWLRDDNAEGHHRRFQLVKGTPNRSAPRVQISYPDSSRKDMRASARGEVPVLLINSNQVKDQVNKMLDRNDPAGGKVTFPSWLPDEFFKELTAETRTSKGWENPKRKRNEAWDLLCYAVAMSLSRLVRIEQIDWEKPPGWARDWDENDLVFGPEITKPLTSPEKRDYDLGKLAESLA